MHHDQKMQQCITECTNCANTCAETITQCLEHGGEHAGPEHIRLLMDCASICRTSAGFMLRKSDLHASVCGVTAEVCRACADSCRDMDGAFMTKCADVCDRCARSCEEMAGQKVERSDSRATQSKAHPAAPLM